MNNEIYLKYAKENGLRPMAWFEVNYPAYAVKVKYLYPTSDPADFRDRALLQLIHIGIPYQTACSLLMINDPHESILQRFKSNTHGPILVSFNKALNRLDLTPIGQQRVERIDYAKNGVSCCFIDGYTGEPFPIDVIKGLRDRFICREIVHIQNGEYPFNPDIERKITEMCTKLNDGKGNNYTQRLRLPDKSKEAEMIPLGPQWMKNLAVAFFIKNSKVVRRLFCDNSCISPFGWLANLDSVKLIAAEKSQKEEFIYRVCKPAEPALFTSDAFGKLANMISTSVNNEYGTEFTKCSDLNTAIDTGQCSLKIRSLANVKRHRGQLLSLIEKKFLPVQIPGIVGTLFVDIDSTEEIFNLASLHKEIDNSESDWHKVVSTIKERYRDKWRNTLIAIERHDLLFRYDVEQYIHYGR